MIAIFTLVFSSCKKTELDNSKGVAKAQTENVNNTDKGGPPPPPPDGGWISMGLENENVNPAFLGSFGWANYIHSLGGGVEILPYRIEYDQNGNAHIVFGYVYMGPLEVVDGVVGNPLAGATMDIRWYPCGYPGTDEETFNFWMPVTPYTIFVNGPGSVYNPTTNQNETGTVMERGFLKQPGVNCYIIKIVVNGQTFYRRVSVP